MILMILLVSAPFSRAPALRAKAATPPPEYDRMLLINY